MVGRNYLQRQWIRTYGLIGNIIIGLLGSGVGYWLLGSVFNISLGEGWIGSILTGAIGAIVILFVINLIVKKRK